MGNFQVNIELQARGDWIVSSDLKDFPSSRTEKGRATELKKAHKTQHGD